MNIQELDNNFLNKIYCGICLHVNTVIHLDVNILFYNNVGNERELGRLLKKKYFLFTKLQNFRCLNLIMSIVHGNTIIMTMTMRLLQKMLYYYYVLIVTYIIYFSMNISKCDTVTFTCI